MLKNATIVVLASACHAAGQQPVRVDPGFSDVSPVMISQRKLGLDQRQPSGFDGVYEFSKTDVFGRGKDLFMRIDGAVTAVFPKSVYIPTKFGMMPDIPAGTIFHIGPLPAPLDESRDAPAETFLDFSASESASRTPGRSARSETYIDFSVASSPTPTPSVRKEPMVGTSSIITDENYRQKRVAALMAYAAGR